MIKNKNNKGSSENRESVNKKIVKCDVNLKEDSCRICIAEFCIKNRETLLEIITTLANLENDSPEYMFKVKGYTDRLNEESKLHWHKKSGGGNDDTISPTFREGNHGRRLW